MIVTALGILIMLLFSCYTHNVQSYTIEITNPVEQNKIMILSETREFVNATHTLYATPVNRALPIGVRGNPEAEPIEISSLEEFKDGSHNGINYFAYTFYAKNAGTASLDYNLKLFITQSENNVDKAIRVKIVIVRDYFGAKIREENTYAHVQSEIGINPGAPEPGTTPFYNNKIVINQNRYGLDVETVDQYTVLMWLHGEDLDCNDQIIKGKLSMTMRFSVLT